MDVKTPQGASMRSINWGIIGTGRIAAIFAEGLSALPDARLLAIGSRRRETATAFGDRFNVPRRYGSYDELVDDPDLDVIYVASPHTLHYAHTRLCLEAGKAVLCEKPFTVNAREAANLIELARSRRGLLVEAMWTRWLPSMARLRQLLADGVIGDLRMLQADFGFRAAFNPYSRLFDRTLAGGGLLDVGVYCVSLASMIFGKPDRVVGLAEIGATGVDEQAAMVLGYPGGQLAVLATGVRTSTPIEATIMGTDGAIRVHAPWYSATRLTITRDGRSETIDVPFEGNGYAYEAAEVGRLLRAGAIESDVLPLSETLAIMDTMDQLRAQWGVCYPNDEHK
jgi:predicted dehydrogenase